MQWLPCSISIISRKHNEWIPNKFGGRENLEAIDFLRRFIRKPTKSIQISRQRRRNPRPGPDGFASGLSGRPGIRMKWDMGWMHDTLEYFKQDPIHRKYHHSKLTFRMLYSFQENFVLPLSHDEVVHGKGSLIGKMPGSEKDRFANLRLLFGYMYAQPGKKFAVHGRRVWAGARVGA